LQAIKATSLEKSVFLRRERDAWTTCENERTAREAAEGDLTKECEISAELRQKYTALATEVREAREKVAPLEKRVGDLTHESEERRTVAEGYRGEVARLEALLAEKDLTLSQAQAELSTAQSEVVHWHQSSAENEKRAKGKNRVFSLSSFYIWINFPDFLLFGSAFQQSRRRRWPRQPLPPRRCRGPLTPRSWTARLLKPRSPRRARGLGVLASGSSLRSRVEALYSRAAEKMREALHAGVKKALAVVSSHYIGIDLPVVCEGYVLPDGEVEAQGELQRLEDAADAPGDALAAFFDAEVELPPLSAQGPTQAGQ